MIELISFRIKNYKSIKDTGTCYLSNDMTVLAGKNESGKTSILEALEDFNVQNNIKKNAYPIDDENNLPEICLTFKLKKDYLKEAHVFFHHDDKENIQLTIKKDGKNKYYINHDENVFDNIKSYNKEIFNKINEIVSDFNEAMKENGIRHTLKFIEEANHTNFKEELNVALETIKRHRQIISKNIIQELFEYAKVLDNKIKEVYSIESVSASVIEDFKKFMPNLILFTTYKDQQIPNSVPFNAMENNEFVQDLSKISDLNFNLIKNPNHMRKHFEHEKNINIDLQNQYKAFWNQDLSNIMIKFYNNTLYFYVEEDGQLYPPEIRSKGKQWHIAFYTRVTARAEEDKKNILLIDEPGLFLHAKAQRDILKKLEDCKKDMQIIYTTHSPYLIDATKLNRVRLVEKKQKKGTLVSKVHAKADKETLTPILTAIGDDCSLGIRVDKENSFVVEGISDYYYIHAFRKLLNETNPINIIPGSGDNVPSIASILFGWGLSPKFILDSDKTSIVKKLQKNLDIPEDNIINILDHNGVIEDIFSVNDFKSLILKDEKTKGDITKLIKKNGGKELLARMFYEDCCNNNIDFENLEPETKENIKKLNSKINSKL